MFINIIYIFLFNRLEFKQEYTSTYDVSILSSSTDTRHSKYVSAEMDSTTSTSDMYYGHVRVLIEVDLVHCDEEIEIPDVNWRNIYIVYVYLIGNMILK